MPNEEICQTRKYDAHPKTSITAQITAGYMLKTFQIFHIYTRSRGLDKLRHLLSDRIDETKLKKPRNKRDQVNNLLLRGAR